MIDAWVLVIVLMNSSGVHIEHIPMADKDACFKAMVSYAAIEYGLVGDPFRYTNCLNQIDGTVVR
jgi:hypothetical protein